MKVTLQSALTSSSTSMSTAMGSSSPQVRNEPHPLSVLLFGKKPPKIIDRRKHPKLKKGMKKLERVAEQISELLGAPEGTFSIELCEERNASISRDGQIAFGIELLEEHQNDDDLLVAILGHEIGHQPWTWPKTDLSKLTKKQRNQLYKDEETKADRFAGRVLADLGLEPDAVCAFLISAAKFEAHPPSDYYPAEVRARIIREAYLRRRRTLRSAGHLSPRVAQRARELR